jgi:hypothetical protein
VVERNLLLALMRRLRRRRRWTDALEGSALGLTVAAPVLAVATAVLRQAGATSLPARQLVAALLAAAAIGACARLARPISLVACARATDRVFAATRATVGGGSSATDDCVLAAVALAEESTVPTAFLRALTAEATTRAQGIPPRRAIPPPASRLSLLAMAGLGLVAVATLVPLSKSRGATRVRSAGSSAGSSINHGASPTRSPSLLRLDEIALASERADTHLAAIAAQQATDQDLAGLASTFDALLDDLARKGMDATSAVMRLRNLANDAQLAADLSTAAKAAGQAAAGALGAALDVGTDGKTLAAAIAAPPGATDVAGPGAARLANRGAAGRAALGRAAEVAAAGLMGPRGADSPSPSPSPSDDGEGRRRLDHGRQPPEHSSDQAPSGGQRPNGQRRLEQLRRDLEETASGCKSNPEACRRRADEAGRGLARLHREGQTAQARQRLAGAARQLLDRISRGDVAMSDREQMFRFARAAHGSTSAGVPGSGPNASDSNARGGEPGEEGWQSGQRSEPGDTVEADPADTKTAGVGAAAEGGGIGSAPGGPLLGPRQVGGPPAGREVEVRLRDDLPGPSRAEIIGGAAARGFASAGYRRLFDDYHAAVEESLDVTLVPPGRRYLVRRYFQLIRPVSR